MLVTGGAGGIGARTSARLAEAGARVIVHHRGEGARARRIVAAIESGGGSALELAADLATEAGIDELMDGLEAQNALPDGVVNLVARQDVTAFTEISAAEWRGLMATNVESVFLVIRRIAERWQAVGCGGAIVNVASIEGLDPARRHAHYATSKAALIMLTRASALELGPSGIRVNAVSPGLIDRKGLAEEWREGVERWRATAPLGRLGTGDDVAGAIVYLLSPAAAWVSGANLVVDGGMSSAPRW